MDRYYYLASTLLSPQFGQAPPMGIEALREICHRLASPDDARMVDCASLTPPPGCGEREGPAFSFLTEFWKRETALRNELARKRAERLGRKADGQLRECGSTAWESEAGISARRALSAEDPLKAERALEKARWDWIESESAGHRFDTVFLTAYALKLLILERLSSFTEHAGMQRFDSMYQAILEGSDPAGTRLGGPGMENVNGVK